MHLNNRENERWNFVLSAVQKEPLTRSMLIQKAIKQPWLLSFVSQTVLASVQAGVSGHKTLYAFYTAFMIQYCQAVPGISENLLLELLPSLLDYLRTGGDPLTYELRLAAYMIIGQICNRAALSSETCIVLCNGIVSSASAAPTSSAALTASTAAGTTTTTMDRRYALICLLKLIQSQESLLQLPLQTFRALLAWSDFIDTLLPSLSTQYDCGRLHRLLVDRLLMDNSLTTTTSTTTTSSSMTNTTTTSTTTAATPSTTNITDGAESAAVLESLLRTENCLDSASIAFLIERIMELVISPGANDLQRERFMQDFKQVFRLLQLRHPDILQDSLQLEFKRLNLKSSSTSSFSSLPSSLAQANEVSGKEREERLAEFLGIAFRGIGNDYIKEAQTSLYLALQHADQNIRLLAVRKLLQQQHSGSKMHDENGSVENSNFISDMICQRLIEDDSADVLLTILQHPNLESAAATAAAARRNKSGDGGDDDEDKDKFKWNNALIGLLISSKRRSLVDKVKSAALQVLGRIWQSGNDEKCLPTVLGMLLITKRTDPACYQQVLAFCASVIDRQAFHCDSIMPSGEAALTRQTICDFNRRLVEQIASRLVVDDPTTVLLRKLFLATDAASSSGSNISGRLFRLLVLNRAVVKSVNDQSVLHHPICQSLLQSASRALNTSGSLNGASNSEKELPITTAGIVNSAVGSGGLPSDELFQQISRSKKSATLQMIEQYLAVFSLSNLASNLQRNNSSDGAPNNKSNIDNYSWLLPATIQQQSLAYSRLVLNIFACCSNYAAVYPALQSIGTKLVDCQLGDDHVFAFCASLWIDDQQVPESLCLAALKTWLNHTKTVGITNNSRSNSGSNFNNDATIAVDYQLCIPYLLIACASTQSAECRKLAVDCLAAMMNSSAQSKLDKSKVYRYGSSGGLGLLGEHTNSLHLIEPQRMNDLLKRIIGCRLEIEADGSQIVKLLADHLSNKKYVPRLYCI